MQKLLIFSEILRGPWPWYISGPLIGLMVPALLITGNKAFGVSSSLRHICAACFPGKVPFFHYDWKKENWNLFFVTGIFIGGLIAGRMLSNPEPVALNPKLIQQLAQYGITDHHSLLPRQLFNWDQLFTIKSLILFIIGGFLVGFGTRYAGGCTSGHGIMGLSTFQWPSLIAVASFFIGGIISATWLLPFILNLTK